MELWIGLIQVSVNDKVMSVLSRTVIIIAKYLECFELQFSVGRKFGVKA